MGNIIRKLDCTTNNFAKELVKLKDLPNNNNIEVQSTVSDIITQVRKNGDRAILEYTNKLDKHKVAKVGLLEVSQSKLIEAEKSIDKDLRQALLIAVKRLTKYHQQQKLKSFSIKEKGGSIGYRIQPLTRVALYVPGGKAAYPSSLLMNAIPAKVAGVNEIIVLNPAPQGEINQTVLAAASICKIDKIFSIGGAQAVAATAYGTNTIPRCDKIVGPGNAYVAEAKRQVFGAIGIDMIAGPSEVLIISDGSGDKKNNISAKRIAADLLAQAEHDEWAQSILLCTNKEFINQVEIAINEYLKTLPRAQIIKKSLQQRGALIYVPNIAQAIKISDEIAPEHLVIATKKPEKIAEKIKYAGGMFLGHYSCEVLGDYCAGTNHVLPTSGSARFSSPLSVHDFYKGTAILNLSAKTVGKIAPIAERLAMSEGLQAHALAAKLRY